MIQFNTIDVMMPRLDFDQVRSWIVAVIESVNFA